MLHTALLSVLAVLHSTCVVVDAVAVLVDVVRTVLRCGWIVGRVRSLSEERMDHRYAQCESERDAEDQILLHCTVPFKD